MPPTLAERQAEVAGRAQAIHDRSIDEGRPLTDEEQAEFDSLVEEATKLQGSAQRGAANAAKLAGIASTPSTDVPGTAGANPPRLPNGVPDFGQAFVDSPVMAALRAQYPDGIPKSAKVTTGTANVGRVMGALLTDPALTQPRSVLDAPTGQATFELLQAITIIDDAPPSIDHHTATFTNVAAVVAEGVAKPEATLAWDVIPLVQEVIAQHIPVTNQALNHNGLLRGIINAFLVNGVRAQAQVQVATDLAAWAGLATQAFDTDLRTTLRRAITTAQTNGSIIGAGPPSIILSAGDAETLDLEQLANIVLSPGEMPQQGTNIWRAPLIVVPGLADGFAYVGDPKQIVWYTSGGLQVSVGWVGNQFIENKQTILAETEGITGVLGAGALVKTDLTLA